MIDCDHEGEHSWWEYDAQNIPLCRVCRKCVEAKLKGYRPEILTGYGQYDVDEPIEPD
jgi:protease II